MPAARYNVLFVCTGNSARSILAEAILNWEGRGLFAAYSAGSQPKGEVNPHALALLERLGYSTIDLRSKSWNEFVTPRAPHMHFIFTLCDSAIDEAHPPWPGEPLSAHWDVPDPAAVRGDDRKVLAAFRDAFTTLKRRIELFTMLPVESLDRIALQERLNHIGQAFRETA